MQVGRHLAVEPHKVPHELERISVARYRSRFVWPKTTLLGIAGAGAVGKTSVRRELIRILPSCTGVLKVTTRPPRPDEISGRDYEFLAEDQFAELIDRKQLILHRTIGERGDYGIRESELRRALCVAKVALVEEEPKGLMCLRDHPVVSSAGCDVSLVYLLAPHPVGSTLLTRYLARIGESRELMLTPTLQRDAEGTLGHRQVTEFEEVWSDFHAGGGFVFIVNDRLTTAVDKLSALLTGKRSPDH